VAAQFAEQEPGQGGQECSASSAGSTGWARTLHGRTWRSAACGGASLHRAAQRPCNDCASPKNGHTDQAERPGRADALAGACSVIMDPFQTQSRHTCLRAGLRRSTGSFECASLLAGGRAAAGDAAGDGVDSRPADHGLGHGRACSSDLQRTIELVDAAPPRIVVRRTSRCSSCATRLPYSAEPTRGLAWTGQTGPCSLR
jgi:hypothetical protein